MKTIWHDNDNGMREADLQGYVDGLIDGQRRAAVEAYLATSPIEAERLAAYRRQNIALHALFDPIAGEDLTQLPPAMARLAAAFEAQLRKPASRAPTHGYRRLAACAVLLLVAGTAGWVAVAGSVWREPAPGVYVPAALQTPAPAAVEGATATPATSGAPVLPLVVPKAEPAGDRDSGQDQLLPERGETPKET